MLQISYIRENSNEVVNRLSIRNIKKHKEIQEVLKLDIRRREIQNKLDEYLSEANNINKDIGNLYKLGKSSEALSLKEKTIEIKNFSKELSDLLNNIESKLNNIILSIIIIFEE